MTTAKIANPFYTVGHSTHSLKGFIGILQQFNIAAVADVRRFPRSRSNPQFNIETLPGDLEADRIEYRHIAELGGRRTKHADDGGSPNKMWRNSSFRNYADYAMTEEFRTALGTLCNLGRSRVSVVMCSEALWWRCHRRIIADYLIASGHDVLHILGSGKCDTAKPTEGAQKIRDGVLVYPVVSCREA